jgi:hypothetical protein
MRIPRCEAGQKEIKRGPRGAEVVCFREGLAALHRWLAYLVVGSQ